MSKVKVRFGSLAVAAFLAPLGRVRVAFYVISQRIFIQRAVMATSLIAINTCWIPNTDNQKIFWNWQTLAVFHLSERIWSDWIILLNRRIRSRVLFTSTISLAIVNRSRVSGAHKVTWANFRGSFSREWNICDTLYSYGSRGQFDRKSLNLCATPVPVFNALVGTESVRMVRICHYGENFAEVFSTGKIRMIELPSTDDIIIIIIIIIKNWSKWRYHS